MTSLVMRLTGAALIGVMLSGCGGGLFGRGDDAPRAARVPAGEPGLYPGETAQMRALVNEYAARHDIPTALLHRVIQRESDYSVAADD